MKWQLVVVVALAVFSLGNPRAQAYCRLTTEAPLLTGCQMEGAPLAWEQRCIPLSVDSRGVSTLSLPELEAAVLRSFREWTSVSCDGEPIGFEVQLTANATCQEAEFNLEDGNVNTIAFLDDWPARGYDPSAFALTTTWFNTSSGLILDADMQLNTLRGDFEICPASGCPNASSTVDLENTLSHEAGHFFGMAHSEVPNSTMFATAGDGEVGKRDLADDDVAGFCEAYGDAALSETCNFTPRNGLQLDCETPSSGCAIAAGQTRDDPRALLFIALIVFGLSRRRHDASNR